jgi:hypothetical protein
VAQSLLQIEKCDRVVVAWDLEPAWGGEACRHDDKERAMTSLRGAKVQLSKVDLLCIERELECWLMADRRALEVYPRLDKNSEVGIFSALCRESCTGKITEITWSYV